MQIGLSIPSTVEGTDRDTLCEWIRRIDAGPFSRLATGERIASPFLDLMGVLSAAAVLTERVPIQALISLAPLHEPVLLAKQAATVDVLSQGRFTLGVGVGMRDYDYTLAGKPEVFGRRVSTLDDRVQVMRDVWRGTYALPEGSPPLGPTPVQPGGPPIFSSSLGPRSMQRASRWADGLAGFHMGPDLDEVEQIFGGFRNVWSDAEREGKPFLQLAFWYALEARPAERLHDFAHDYLMVFGKRVADAQAGLCSGHSPGAIRDILRRLEDMGCDEAILTPTTADLDELSATEDFVASL